MTDGRWFVNAYAGQTCQRPEGKGSPGEIKLISSLSPFILTANVRGHEIKATPTVSFHSSVLMGQRGKGYKARTAFKGLRISH